MWRQNIISNMREQQARKRRQEAVRTPSPKREPLIAGVISDPSPGTVSSLFDNKEETVSKS